ncbi:MAG: DUF2384 domain-containing protein [Elusimicrobiota bacterium]|nr:MAG: DUF2384 domain-containing protein [Elusimicrobiota bacterium]
MATTLAPSLSLLFSLLADRPQAGAAASQTIHDGFKWANVRRAQEAFQIKDKAFARIIGVSDRTLTRTKRDKASLDPVASDRLYRALRVLKMAVDLFEDVPPAVRWLQRPQPGLGGKVPMDMLDTDPGSRAVETLLGQLEYGVLP